MSREHAQTRCGRPRRQLAHNLAPRNRGEAATWWATWCRRQDVYGVALAGGGAPHGRPDYACAMVRQRAPPLRLQCRFVGPVVMCTHGRYVVEICHTAPTWPRSGRRLQCGYRAIPLLACRKAFRAAHAATRIGARPQRRAAPDPVRPHTWSRACQGAQRPGERDAIGSAPSPRLQRLPPRTSAAIRWQRPRAAGWRGQRPRHATLAGAAGPRTTQARVSRATHAAPCPAGCRRWLRGWRT